MQVAAQNHQQLEQDSGCHQMADYLALVGTPVILLVPGVGPKQPASYCRGCHQ